MSSELSSASLEFSGEAAVEQAIAVLRRFQEDGQFDEVHVELSTSWPQNRGKDRQTTLNPKEKDESEEVQAKTISSGTSHHKVLTAISDSEDSGQIPVTQIIEDIDLPDGTVYAAMSTLHERGLLSREKGPQGNFLYTITNFGESELERLGRADV